MIKSSSQKQRIKERMGFLFDGTLLDEMLSVSRLRDVDQDQVIISPGDELMYIPFVIDGTLKILRQKQSGEELLLYYIEAGDTCAMSLQCCMRKSKSEIKAVAMEPTTLLMIPVEYAERWMNNYPSWRNYMFESYHMRMTELMETIDAIAFMRLDERLERYLTDQAKIHGSLELHYTHQRIAEDLHSSRVVISRLLKQMESKGLIQLHRSKIVLHSI